MTQISERKRDLLRRLVEEYVATGEPVGSKTLVERSGLPVSSSTGIRRRMGAMMRRAFSPRRTCRFNAFQVV